MVLGKLTVQVRSILWMIVGQGPIALAVGAEGVFRHIYPSLSFFFSFPFSLGDIN